MPDHKLEDRIVEVAEDLFLDKGFALTSTTEIAKKVGCNQALVHYYFRTKENLFQQVFMRKTRLFVSVFLEKDNSGDPFLVKLERRIEAHFDLLKQNPRLPFLLINELITNKERRGLLRDFVIKYQLEYQVMGQFEEELQVEINKGALRDVKATDLLLNIISLNVFTFISFPIYKDILVRTEDEQTEYLKNRKKEVVKSILNSIKL